MEAVATWLRYPDEIEASLLAEYGACADIRDWHRLTLDRNGDPVLSSRRLLVLLNGLPDRSWFKTVADRDGDWTDQQKIAAETFSEVSRAVREVSTAVSVLVAAHGGKKYDLYTARYFPSPVQRRELADSPAEPVDDNDWDEFDSMTPAAMKGGV